jgi:hypothetical protein
MTANWFRLVTVSAVVLICSIGVGTASKVYALQETFALRDAATDDQKFQERSARAAEIQAAQSAAQTPFVYTGAIAAILALGLSALALLHSVNTARRQQRAYILLDHVGLLHPTHDHDFKKRKPTPADLPLLVIHLKNFGLTPANHVLHWAAFDVLPVGVENGVPPPATLQNVSSGLVAPSGVLTKKLLFHRPITPEEAERIRRGEYAVYVRGWVSYRDAFKCQRETRFLMRYQGTWPPPLGAEFYYCDSGNSAN